MKRALTSILVLLMLANMSILSSFAAEPEINREIETVYVEGVGILEIETVTTVYPSLARSSTNSGSKTKTVRQSGSVIATITLNASFGYDGSRAWVNSASATHSTSGGWSYGGESISKSGGTATLTATLSKFAQTSIPVSLSITCSPSGTIS